MPNYTPSQVYDKYVALQKQLATNITNKGVTASQTELYDNLIDKVAQIENLKGEERTLENFTNVLSEPKSIVQLEYPEPKNLFDKDNANIIIGYPDAENVINPATTTRTVYIPCAPNTTYTVSKTVTARFCVAFADVLPASGVTVTGRIQNNTATSITATSSADSKYIVVWVYHTSYDTSITLDKILATLQIEKGSTATTYEPYLGPKTLNAKLGSKNLLNPSVYYSTSTFNGVTYTVNNDTITMTGTAGASLYINLLSNNPDAKLDMPEQLKNKKLKLFAYGNTSTIEAVLYNEAGAFVRTIHSNDKSATDTTGCSKWGLRLRFTNGVTYNDTIQIMICEEGVEDSPSYTPYISDFSTVNVTRCGKNLIPYPYAETRTTIEGITVTYNSDNSIVFNGTATAQFWFKLFDNIPLPAGNYWLTGTPSGYGAMKSFVYIYDSSGKSYNAHTTDGVLCALPADNYSGRIYVAAEQVFKNVVFKPQLELGTAATEYETYQGQTYTPTASGEVTGITNLYPTTTLLTNNAGVVFEEVTGQTYKEIIPSTDKNGIVKAYQPSVDNTVDSNITSDNIKKDIRILGVTGDYICNYTYDETTKELVLIL